MQISEGFPSDLWIFYRCISFCLPPSHLFMEGKFEVCHLPKVGLTCNFARYLFHLSLLRGIKEVGLLSQPKPSCVDKYQADIYPVLVYAVISFSCPGCFGFLLMQLIWEGTQGYVQWSFENGFVCELAFEAQKTVTEKWREKSIYSIFILPLFWHFIIARHNIQCWHQRQPDMSNWGSKHSHFL